MHAQKKENYKSLCSIGVFITTFNWDGCFHVAFRRGDWDACPGETKLEVDRRHIRNKITQIRNELKEVEQHRERTREQRKNKRVYQIGLIGYTNAGKSTIMNMLTTANTYEQDQLFATLDPLTKKMATSRRV